MPYQLNSSYEHDDGSTLFVDVAESRAATSIRADGGSGVLGEVSCDNSRELCDISDAIYACTNEAPEGRVRSTKHQLGNLDIEVRGVAGRVTIIGESRGYRAMFNVPTDGTAPSLARDFWSASKMLRDAHYTERYGIA